MNSTQLLKALIINRLPAVRPVEKRTLFDSSLTIDDYRSVTIPQIETIIGRKLRTQTVDHNKILPMARQDYSYLQANSISTALKEDMPLLFQQIKNPPFLLFLRGEMSALKNTLLAVVGTRHPSEAAIKSARITGYEIAESNMTLVSGLAKGIDSVVMNAAVQKHDAVIAILGNGIDYIYPGQNQLLAERIIENGGIILSEYSPGIAPMRHHFPARNRIISALCQGVLIIEAPKNSGALITIDFAREQGRNIFVHKVSVGNNDAEGTNKLIAEGVPSISSVHEIHSQLGRGKVHTTATDSESLFESSTLYYDTVYNRHVRI